ncbi:EXORDIUM family protein [Anaeromyxobacter paludicola]|uniref:Phosphate-induced protein 1 conserved region n=1 Tax=Anaeromyxobacter paludicola TaxID=2918171 RepID=A0ABM7X898_9BACT|nr:EXORDIUM family protein [Anaeromyxobacter paludicola]BDG08065.1 hypothetical protein AMPC_11780 [Anaeromyxobacter paludicola]
MPPLGRASLLLSLLLSPVGASAGQPDPDPAPELRPDGKGAVPRGQSHQGQVPGPASVSGTSANGIGYHGGPVILGQTNVYYIWYGAWTDTAARTILDAFAQGIGGSPYFGINGTYYSLDASGASHPVSNAVALAGESFCTSAASGACWQGASNLSDSAIQAVVAGALASGALKTPDPNGVYFVLTSPEVTKSGFCTSYCGWHTHATLQGLDVKYAFVGDAATQCPSACMEQTIGPNGDAGADGMASVVAHELEEAVTDPDLNAWYDRRGRENADKCAWTFGTTSTAPNGALYNLTLGGREYLIQRNWVNAAGGYCALQYP